MTPKLKLADSFISAALSGVLNTVTFRPGSDGKWDTRHPPTDPDEIASLVETIRIGNTLSKSSIYTMLAYQHGLTRTDSELEDLARDDLYPWTPEARRHWIQCFYDALYPGIPIPPGGPSIEVVRADSDQWSELRDQQADLAAEEYPLIEAQR